MKDSEKEEVETKQLMKEAQNDVKGKKVRWGGKD